MKPQSRPRCPACYGAGFILHPFTDAEIRCGFCDGQGFDPIDPPVVWELRIWDEHEQRWGHPDENAGSDANLYPSLEAAQRARDSLRAMPSWGDAAFDIRLVSSC